MNLVIGAVLFVVVIIVLVTNNQKVSDLKNSIKKSAVEGGVSVAHGFLARNSSGDYVPKNAYYLKLIEKPSGLPDKEDGVVDQIVVQYANKDGSDGLNFAIDALLGKCAVLYRPETRVLYKVQSARLYNGTTLVSSSMDSPASFPLEGTVLVDLKRNIETTSVTPMFQKSDTETSSGEARMRTIIGVQAPMGGNTASGV